MWFCWWVGATTYKCFAFFVGFVVLSMCGGKNFELVFLFCFGFVDVWGFDFHFCFGGFVEARGIIGKFVSFFCSIYAHGFNFQKPLCFCVVMLMYGDLTCYNLVDAWGQHLINFWHFWALLMHGDLTCWSYFLYFVIMLMCGDKKFFLIQVFGVLDIGMWGQQLTTSWPLWLCWCVEASNVG